MGLDIFKDTAIIATTVNVINTITNIIWSIKLKSVQGNGEILKALKEANAEKEVVIKDLLRKKNTYKMQFQSLLLKYKKLEGERSLNRNLHEPQ